MKLYLLPIAFLLGLSLVSCRSDNPQASSAPGAPAQPAAQPAPPPQPIEIAAGTLIEARVGEALSTARNRVGDRFSATLELPVAVNGAELLPRGARMEGHVTTSTPSGRLKGRAAIGITMDAVEYHGQMTPIVTNLDFKSSEAHKKRNLELIGGGAGVGALIGGLVGGGKGALIGAGAGGGAGTGVAAGTGKLEVEIPAETVFTFRLKAPLQLTN
jgi:hypothetical protein